MTILSIRPAALVGLVLLAGCSRAPDVAAGRFEARMEGAAAETVSGGARLCAFMRGGTVSMVSDDKRFGMQFHGTYLEAGRAPLVDVKQHDPEQPRTVSVALFTPAGEPYVTGGTLRITSADSASVRGTFQVKTRPAEGEGGASMTISGAFATRLADPDCGRR